MNRSTGRGEGERCTAAGRERNMAEADGSVGPLGKRHVGGNRLGDVEGGRAVDVEVARKRGRDFHGSSLGAATSRRARVRYNPSVAGVEPFRQSVRTDGDRTVRLKPDTTIRRLP